MTLEELTHELNRLADKVAEQNAQIDRIELVLFQLKVCLGGMADFLQASALLADDERAPGVAAVEGDWQQKTPEPPLHLVVFPREEV